MTSNEIISKSIESYGRVNQTIVCMEELAELTQALSKELRGKSDVDHLAEEIADVRICLEMISQMYPEAEKKSDGWYRYKIERMCRRMIEGWTEIDRNNLHCPDGCVSCHCGNHICQNK